MKPLLLTCVLSFLGSFVSSGYEAIQSDNICGIRLLERITNPSKINYSLVLKTTPEVKKIEREKISKESVRGKILLAEAEQRITKLCTEIMKRDSYCSVWKNIKHSSKKIDDITNKILNLLREDFDPTYYRKAIKTYKGCHNRPH